MQGWKASHGAVLLEAAPGSGLSQPHGSSGSVRECGAVQHIPALLRSLLGRRQLSPAASPAQGLYRL